MLFNSYQFIFCFLPVALVVFYFLCQKHLLVAARAWLVLCSLAFYAYWDYRYLVLLLCSIAFNYTIGSAIDRAPQVKARWLLALGVSVDLSLLCYYKYAMFLLGASNRFMHTDFVIPQIVLPLGISFFTFTQIAYLVDVYRREVKDFHWLGFSLFVTFFPHLIAGPIMWHKSVIPQFYRLRNFIFSQRNFALGLAVFIIGLSKKVLIADNIAGWVSPVFNNASRVGILEAWAGALAYTFQLFFDFSGYSDMAVGLAFMLNIVIPINFESPYLTTSIIDFWRSWHISLSTFLRDYLYIPLGGNRCGKVRHYWNMFLTMLLGGIWHGAGWTFVAWGGLHGTYLIVNHKWRDCKIALPTPIAWLLTFTLAVIGWVFFRAAHIGDALKLLATMFGGGALTIPWNAPCAEQVSRMLHLPIRSGETYLIGGKTSLLVIVFLFVFMRFLPPTRVVVKSFQPRIGLAIALSLMFTVSILSLNKVSEFLYFQF